MGVGVCVTLELGTDEKLFAVEDAGGGSDAASGTAGEKCRLATNGLGVADHVDGSDVAVGTDAAASSGRGGGLATVVDAVVGTLVVELETAAKLEDDNSVPTGGGCGSVEDDEEAFCACC